MVDNLQKLFRGRTHFGGFFVLFLAGFSCISPQYSEECRQFYREISSSERDRLFPNYDLDRQLFLAECGLEEIPPTSHYSFRIAAKGKSIVPTLLERLESAKNPRSKEAILITFLALSIRGEIDDEAILHRIRIVIDKMPRGYEKEELERRFAEIRQNVDETKQGLGPKIKR